MRTRSQRHLASAQGSSLLAWLPWPRRGARSPPACLRIPAPVSRSWVRGEAFAPHQAHDFGGTWGQPCSVAEPGQRGQGEGLPGKGLGQQQGSVPTWGGDIWPLLSVFPSIANLSPRARPAFPGVPPRLLPVCLLAEPVAVLARSRGSAVPRVLQPGTKSYRGGDPGPPAWCS